MNFGLIQKLSWSSSNSIKEMDPPSIETPQRHDPFDIIRWSMSFIPFPPWAKNSIEMPTTINKKLKRHLQSRTCSFTGDSIETPQRHDPFDIIRWGMSFIPFSPWAKNSIEMPTTINKKLKRHGQSRGDIQSRTQYSTVRFRPYVSRVPWHTGPRAFLSQLFPRYGHYCGPNWSSGKEGGSLIWDKRPIDWLDFCCYCHDIGYDSHDQAELLKADLAFLECVEKPNMSIEGDAHIAHVYKLIYISGLRTILIPYRQHLLKLQSSQFSLQSAWLSNLMWKQGKLSKT